MTSYQKELLSAALEAREREVIEYQVNIDNYARAIEKIGDDAQLQAFKEQLEHLLQSSLLEQRKAVIMRDVVKEQLQ